MGKVNHMQILQQRQGLDLDIKIKLSETRIREWVEHWGKNKVYVSFSGGKDSTVLLHLIRRLYPEIKAVFVDTGLEYPEIKDFVKSIDNVETLTPKKNFTQVIKEYGYPVISKNVSRYVRDLQNPTEKNQRTRDVRNGKTGSNVGTLSKKWRKLVDAPFKCSEQCCDVMKKNPIKVFEKRTKMKPFIGMMADESRARKLKFAKNNCNSFEQKNPQSNPLSFWTEQDILKYLKTLDVNYCDKIYGEIVIENNKYRTTKAKRTGCMFCMFGVHMERTPNRFQQMEISHPSIHNYCIEKLGCGKVLDFIKVDYTNKLNSEEEVKTCATKHVIPPKHECSGILPKFT